MYRIFLLWTFACAWKKKMTRCVFQWDSVPLSISLFLSLLLRVRTECSSHIHIQSGHQHSNSSLSTTLATRTIRTNSYNLTNCMIENNFLKTQFLHLPSNFVPIQFFLWIFPSFLPYITSFAIENWSQIISLHEIIVTWILQ